MIYLEKDDLITQAYERLIDESSKDKNGLSEPVDPEATPEVIANLVLDQLELQNIELIKSYIGSRFDVSKIFNAEDPIRNQLLIRILTTLVLYDVFRRNAARKVPSDYKDNYDAALETLEKIATGRIPVDGLPPKTDEGGNPISNSIWGNNTNKNFYI